MRIEHLAEGVTLYCGDCREILPSLGRVDAVVTDPPYGVELVHKKNDFRGSQYFDRGKSTQATRTYLDTPAHVARLITEAIEPSLELAKRALIFPGTRMLYAYPQPESIGSVFIPNGAGSDTWGFRCSQPILFYGKCPYQASGKGRRPNSFCDNQPGEDGIDHPCPKPLAWMRWAVARATFSGETILDPFMGSGTTGVAAVKLGRRFIGIEIEPKYFAIACRRIEEALRQPDMFIEAPKAAKQEMLAL